MNKRTIPERSQVSGKPLTPFGRWLAAQIAKSGMNQTQFAAEHGINANSIATWLYDERRTPNAQSCYQIATGIGVPYWRVLEAAGLPYDGLKGLPRSAPQMALFRIVASMSDDQARDLLTALQCPSD